MQCCIWIAIVRFQSILAFLQIFLDPCFHKSISYPIFSLNLSERHMLTQMQTYILHFLIFAIWFGNLNSSYWRRSILSAINAVG